MRTQLRSFAETDESDEERTLRLLLGQADSPPPERHAVMSSEDFPEPPAARTSGPPERVQREDPAESMVDKDGFDWQLVAGLLLDAGLNKGRGLGQLVGAYASNREAASRQKQQHKLRLEEIAARKGGDEFDEWYKRELIKGAEEDRKLRGEREGGVQGRFTTTLAEKSSPDSATSTTKTELVRRGAAARVEGAELEKEKLAPVIAANVANEAGARTDAVTDAERDNPKELTKAQKEQLARDDRDFEERVRARGVAERAEKSRTEDREADTFRAKYKNVMIAADKARQLQKAFKEQPDDVRGFGFWQRNAPDLGGFTPGLTPEDIHQRQLFQQLINPETKELFGTALSAGERESRDKAFATGRFSSEQEQISAVNLIADELYKQLKGGAVGKEEIVRRVLAEHGLDDLIPEVQVTPQAAPPGLGKLTTPMGRNVPLGEGPDEDELQKRYGSFGVRF